MHIKDLTVEQFKALVESIVEAKLEEILVDPDNDLEVKEEIIEKLKEQRNSRKNRVTMNEIIKELSIEINDISG